MTAGSVRGKWSRPHSTQCRAKPPLITELGPPHSGHLGSSWCQSTIADAAAAMSRSLSLSWNPTSRRSCTSPSVRVSTAKIGEPFSRPSSRCRWRSNSTKGLVIRSLLPPALVVNLALASSFSRWASSARHSPATHSLELRWWSTRSRSLAIAQLITELL